MLLDSGSAGFYYRIDPLKQIGFKVNDLKNITWDGFVTIGKWMLSFNS